MSNKCAPALVLFPKKMKTTAIPKDLIAPCGMNCAICSRYLAYKNNLSRSHCIGCRPRNKRCTYLFKNCTGPRTISNNNALFCFECVEYPCKQINRMDKRYRENYAMSVKENLEYIKSKGIETFIQEQIKKYTCPKCAGLISIHNRKCFACDTVTKLVEKKKQGTTKHAKSTKKNETERIFSLSGFSSKPEHS
jgi:hypothetical protein